MNSQVILFIILNSLKMCTRSKRNFKFNIIILLCSCFVISQGLKSPEVIRTSIFNKIFALLHKEPTPPLPKTRAIINTKWIEQKLDHFNGSDTRTWNMRYLTNTEIFQPGGPLFLFMGGEWKITPGYISGGLFYDVASEVDAYLVYSEHRYYGESYPTE